MKKILFALLLLPFAAYATIDSVNGNSSGWTYGATDTCVTNGNITFDGNVSTGAMWIISNYTVGVSGTPVVTLANAGDAWKDSSSGTKTYPSITLSGNNAAMKISSGSGTITATGCALTFNGTGQTADIQKSAIFGILTVGASAVLTMTIGVNAPGVVVSGATAPIVLGDNSTFTVNGNAVKGLMIKPLGTTSLWSIGTGVTWNGSAIIGPYVTTAGYTLTRPATTYTGTGNFDPEFSTKGFIDTITGNYSWAAAQSGTTVYHYIDNATETFRWGYGPFTYNLCSFNIGSATAITTGSQIINLGAGTYNIKGTWGVQAANKNFQTNYQTASITIQGTAYTLKAGNPTTPGTSTVTLNNAAKMTITTANYPFYNLTINPSVTGAVDSFAVNAGCDTILGTLTLSTGKPKLMNKTYCLNYVNNLTTVGDTAFRSNWLFVGGNFTRAAGSISKIDSPVVFQSGRDGITSTETDVTMNGCTGYQWYVRKLKTDIFKLMDNVTVNRFWLDSGIVIQNKKVLSDSIHVALDSINVDTTVVVWTRDSIGAAARLSYAVNAEKQFLGTVDTTHVWSNSKQRIPIFENKTGGAVKYYDSVYTTRYVVKDGMVRAMAAIKATKFIDTANDTSAYLGKVYCDTFVLRYRAKKSFTGIYMRICTGVVDTTGAGVGTLPLYFPASTLSYASSPAQDTTKKAASHAITVTGCTMDSFALATALPTGLSLTKASGLISGTPTAATGQATYKVYGYKGASVDSCNFVLTVIALVSSRDKLGAFKAYRLGAYRNGAFRDPAYR